MNSRRVLISRLTSILALALILGSIPLMAQQRLIVIDQDGVGPGGSDVQSIMLLAQAPNVKVLGITVVSGDVWSDVGAKHILRGLEEIGRTDIPVFTGSAFPLIRTSAETNVAKGLYGSAWYEGAFGGAGGSSPMKEGEPHARVTGVDAVRFLIKVVHEHPHEVTVFAGGPLTNIALAIRADPEFATLAKKLVVMGGSIHPATDDPEFAYNPRHEFNFWFDPEAAHIALTAPWAAVVQTTVDVSLQAKLSPNATAKLKSCHSKAAKYMSRYGSGSFYMWDELAALAWIDPTIISSQDALYEDVNLDHGYSYGDTITWSPKTRPQTLSLQQIQVQTSLNLDRFQTLYLNVICSSNQ